MRVYSRSIREDYGTLVIDGNAAILHRAEQARAALALTHGAGGNLEAPLLVSLAVALQRRGFHVLRYNLSYRRERPSGPPVRGKEQDRQCVGIIAAWLRDTLRCRVYAGGHSYGGRMTTEYAAAHPGVADGLLLLSYPLHPPRKPEELRTTHFPELTTPCFFVHGERDPFGLPDEMTRALSMISGPAHLELIHRAGHDLKGADIDGIASRFEAWTTA